MSLRRLAATLLGAVLVATASAVVSTTGASAAKPLGQVLISSSQGVIYSYDIRSGALEVLTDQITPNNFDIMLTGPNELLIANIGAGSDGALYTLDMTTLTEALVVQDNDMSGPGSLAFTPRDGGVTYIADVNNQHLYKLTTGSTTPVDVASGIDRVAVDKQGVVYYTASSGSDSGEFGRLDGDFQKVAIATTDSPGFFAAFALTPSGVAYLPGGDSGGPAVFKVDAQTGDVLATYRSTSFSELSDVAIGPSGDVYVVDCAAGALFRINADGGDIETLISGGLGDAVFITLAPFHGF